MNNDRFLGVCILLGAVIIACAIFFSHPGSHSQGRYAIHVSDSSHGTVYVFDTVTGRFSKQN